MKILYHHRIGSKDGQFVHIEEMVSAFRAAGHEVCIAGPGSFDSQSFGGESSLVSQLKSHVPKALYELLELAYNIVDYARLARMVRKFKPDVIYERYNLLLLSGVMARRRFGVPLLLEVNAPLFAERSAYDGLRLARLACWAERRAWKAADHVFAVTHVLADMIVNADVARSRITVTPNGVNHSRFGQRDGGAAAKSRLGLDPQSTVLGFVGFARAWHGLDAVIELLAEYRDLHRLHFLLVGDGPVTEALRRQAEDAGLSHRVTVTGVVGRDDVQAHVDAFDIAMLPNVVAYASPLKLFEYMACGKAIVAPDQPNITEILTADRDALLFEPRVRETFKAMIRRLVVDEPLRVRLGSAARDTLVRRDFSWQANARRVVMTTDDLIGDKSMHNAVVRP